MATTMGSVNNIERFRQRLAAGELCIGTGISFVDPAVSELVGDVGFDFTWIDMEHGPLDLATALNHVTAVRGTDAAPLVRVPCNHADVIKPILDFAPAGIIVPNVKSAEEAENAVQACRYPPRGVRGFGPRRGTRHGMLSPADFMEQAADEPLVIVQLEHVQVVERLDEIVAVPGIHSFCLGPNDFSGSMGKMGQIDDPEVAEALDLVCRRVKEADRFLGTSTFYTEANFARWLQRGVDWISLSVDWSLMSKSFKGLLEQARQGASTR